MKFAIDFCLCGCSCDIRCLLEVCSGFSFILTMVLRLYRRETRHWQDIFKLWFILPLVLLREEKELSSEFRRITLSVHFCCLASLVFPGWCAAAVPQTAAAFAAVCSSCWALRRAESNANPEFFFFLVVLLRVGTIAIQRRIQEGLNLYINLVLDLFKIMHFHSPARGSAGFPAVPKFSALDGNVSDCNLDLA